MSDKEEIIFILTRTNSIKDGIRTETHKDNAMTRQEAIKRIQKQLKEQCWLNDCDSEDVAIECLNALLEVKQI